MNEPISFTNDEARVSGLIRQARPEAALPPRFQEAVWRRIETARAPASERLGTFLESLLNKLLVPRVAFALIVAAATLAGLAGGLHGSAAAKEVARERYVASVAPFAAP